MSLPGENRLLPHHHGPHLFPRGEDLFPLSSYDDCQDNEKKSNVNKPHKDRLCLLGSLLAKIYKAKRSAKQLRSDVIQG